MSEPATEPDPTERAYLKRGRGRATFNMDATHMRMLQKAVDGCSKKRWHNDRQYLNTSRTHDHVQADIKLRKLTANDSTSICLEVFERLIPSFYKLESFLHAQGLENKHTGIMWSMLSLMMQKYTKRNAKFFSLACSFEQLSWSVYEFNGYCTSAPKAAQLALNIFAVLIRLQRCCIECLPEMASSKPRRRRAFRGRIPTGQRNKVKQNFDKHKKNVAACVNRSGSPVEARWRILDMQKIRAQSSISHLVDLAKKQVKLGNHRDELQRLQQLLSLTRDQPVPRFTSPISYLPVTRNARYFEREWITERIDHHFSSQALAAAEGVRTVALHGPVGVGKSQVALEYAYKKAKSLAVFWIRSETTESLASSFFEVANALGLEGAAPSKYVENRILVLNWLQKTEYQWLLVYDNAQNFDSLLPYWPVADRGRVLLTTQNHHLAHEPAEIGIEMRPFNTQLGASFILHLMSFDPVAGIKFEDLIAWSRELSDKLRGHALTITLATRVMAIECYSIPMLIAQYDDHVTNTRSTHFQDCFSGVCQLLFKSLTGHFADMLGIMCYLSPSSIPICLFQSHLFGDSMETLSSSEKDLFIKNTIKYLVERNLVQHNESTGSLSVHRLVQCRYRGFSDLQSNRRFFEKAARLLLEAVSPSQEITASPHEWRPMSNSQLYLEHVLNLRNQYNIDRRSLVPTLDFVKLLGSLARFLLDSAFYKKAENTELIAREAFQELCEEDERVSADLNILQALSLAHQGSFSRAKGLLDETYLYTLANAFPPAELQLSRAFTIMGNVEASLGNIVSMRWHAKAIKQRLDGYRREPPKRDDEHAAIPLLEKVQANLGRFFFGDSDDLDDRDEVGLSPVVALAYASDSRYWVMRAYEHFRLGNLARRVEEFGKAHEEYANARQLWRHGTRLDTHHFHGACLYKLGCVACDRCEFESASVFLRASLTIAKLHKEALAGDYARVLYKLSVVLRLQPGNEFEAEGMAEEARVIVTCRLGGSQRKDSEAAYDKLVYILWR